MAYASMLVAGACVRACVRACVQACMAGGCWHSRLHDTRASLACCCVCVRVRVRVWVCVYACATHHQELVSIVANYGTTTYAILFGIVFAETGLVVSLPSPYTLNPIL